MLESSETEFQDIAVYRKGSQLLGGSEFNVLCENGQGILSTLHQSVYIELRNFTLNFFFKFHSPKKKKKISEIK